MSAVEAERLILISTDAHAGADLRDYKPYLEKGLHDQFDAWADGFHDGWDGFDSEMLDVDDPYIKLGVSSFGSPYNWDHTKRLEHMDGDGIAAEVIFPNTVPPFFPRALISAPAPSNAEDYRLRWAGVRAHNRWMADFCAALPGRRGGLAQTFLFDVDDAVAEVRWAREAGLMGVLIPSDHQQQLVNLYEKRLDPFWAACAELQMPVHRHSAFVGPPETDETGPGANVLGLHEVNFFLKRTFAHLILGGVFERFPTLDFVLTECPITWVPEDMHIMELEVSAALTKGTPLYSLWHEAAASLSKRPWEYFGQNCYLGASLMQRSDIDGRHDVGVDRILWGSDYPHHEGSWPRTELALRLLFSDVPEDEVRQMTSLTAAHVYGFDLERLQPIADRIGPTIGDITKPITKQELPAYSSCPTIAEALGQAIWE